MKRMPLLLSAAVLFLLAVTRPAFAATQNATVYGSVYDATGAHIAGATVIMENRARGFSRTTTTGSDGSYTFAEVPPAEGYQLTAIVGGKTIDIRTGITINVGDERVILPPLQAQPAAVAGAAPAVKRPGPEPVKTETVSTAVSGVITRDQLQALPLYNRNFLALGMLTPNTHDPEASSELRGASFSVAGARASENNFLLDGADNVASGSNQAVPFQVNDSIQEFRVISSLAPAEYGRNVGGVVNVVTRSAGNDFHGSVFGYFGSDSLNADNPLSVYTGGTTFDRGAAYAGPTNAAALPGVPIFLSPTNYNQYVATAETWGYCTDSIGVAGAATPCVNTGGGLGANTRFDPAALLAPRNQFRQPFDSKQFGANAGKALIKDKLFLFGSYEGTLIDNPNPIFERVPSSFDRTYNPLGDPASPRVIPAGTPYFFGTGSPDYALTHGIVSLYPAANVIGVPDALEFYQGFAPNYTNVHNGLARLDWVKSNKTNLSFRYVVQALDQLHDDSLPVQAQYAGNGAIRDALNHNLNLSLTHSFSSNVITEARAAFTRFRVKETAQDANFDATTLGLPSRQLMTFLLSGLDTQYSGAHNAYFDAAAGGGGAFAGWADGFWNPILNLNIGNSPMLPTMDGLFPMARIGAPLNAPGLRRDDTYLVSDTVSILKGRHSLKVGAEFRTLRNEFLNAGLSRGYAVISNIGEFTSDSETCNETCRQILGFPNVESFFAPSFDYALRQRAPYDTNLSSWTTAWFVQDTFRFNSRLTFNAGLRYEYFSVPEAGGNQLWNFFPAANGLVQRGSASVTDPYGSSCAPTATNFSAFEFLQSVQDWTCGTAGTGRVMGSDKNNFAPRFGLAWDVFGTSRTVVRGGIGLYYDQSPVSYVSQLAYNRPTLYNRDNPQAMYGQNFVLGSATPCDPLGFTQCSTGATYLNPANLTANNFQTWVSASSPQAMYARDVFHSDNAMSRQIDASVQQAMGRNLVLEVGYVGSSARHLPVIYNSGFENEWFCTNSAPNCDLNSNFPVFTMTNRGGASYHSLMTRMRLTDWHGLRVNGGYYWSKSLDNASNSIYPLLPMTFFNDALSFQLLGKANPAGACLVFSVMGLFPPGTCNQISPAAGLTNLQAPLVTTGAGQVFTTPYTLPQDPIGLAFLHDDRGPSDFNSTHRAVVDYTWDVPTRHKGSKFWDGWQLSGIFTAQSGQPFTIFAGPVAGEITQRALQSGPVTVTGDPNAMVATTNLALPGPACVAANPNASPFAVPAPGDFLFNGTVGSVCPGNSRRNDFTGPSYINMNFAVQKVTPVFGESRKLVLRAEFFNLFDRANYYNPISTLSTDGVSLNPDFGKVKSAHDPRQIQFAARFSW